MLYFDNANFAGRLCSFYILGSDWTYGCVGMSDSDIEEFFDEVPVGTKVVIQK